MTPTCCTCPTERPATLRLRVLPRRTDAPLNDAIRRALMWPGVASPVDLLICGRPACLDRVRGLATCVLASEALGDETATRTVAGGPE